jgi:uncharacterized protein DUF664
MGPARGVAVGARDRTACRRVQTYVRESCVWRREALWNHFSPDLTATRTRALQFLRECQERLRASIAALDEDSELVRPRKTNWGEMKETRWIIAQVIEHDHYHAGEINHIRSLRSDDDRWAARKILMAAD